MGNAFRFVVVGSGNIAGTYARVLAKLPDTELAAIVSRSGHRPAGVSNDVPVAPALADLRIGFDAVILATPNGVHHQGAIEAARLGKHVLTEKVLDISSEAMDDMITACRNAHVKLGVAFQRRMSPDNQVVKRLLEEGALGRILGADLSAKFYRDQAYYASAPYRGNKALDGGGPFMQQAAHNLDIYTWFFGVPKHVVSALGTLCHDMESEDHGAVLLTYDSGMIGTIIASTSCKPGFPARLEIHAERGTVVLENDVITLWAIDGRPNPSQSGATGIHSGASSAAVADTAGHQAIVADFVHAVRDNREPMVPGEEARRTTELVLKIYASRI